MNRPVTVTVAQGILLVFAAVWFSSLVFNLVGIVRIGTNASPLRLISGLFVLICIVTVQVIAFWGLAKRRRYGKWLGVASLSFLWVVLLLIQIRPPQGPVARFEYTSTAQKIGGLIGVLAVNGVMLIVILRLAFAKSVDRFFTDPAPLAQVETKEG